MKTRGSAGVWAWRIAILVAILVACAAFAVLFALRACCDYLVEKGE